jgi:hypothetical protein
MENLQIKIVLTDGEKEAKTSINIEDYQMMKELHGVSLIDEQVDVLLNEITMEKKQTAVEWLVEEINKNGEEIHKNGNWIPTHMIEQAKQMEKEQMKEIYGNEVIVKQNGHHLIQPFEQYYNETYGGQDESK